MPRALLELTGKKFGKLTVIKRVENNARGESMWLCNCECGGTVVAKGCNLKNGRTRSCGCIVVNRGHGLTHTKVYKEWDNIKTRCYNPRATNYVRYGARGITLCDEWRDDFQTFHNDVSKLPHFNEPGYTLDRIDNNGNYEPGNVRWADRITQSNNRNDNVRFTYNGETHTLVEWSRILGVNYGTVCNRLHRGWSIERALTVPVRGVRSNLD